MHEKTLNVLYKWLKQAGYVIALPDLQKQFLSHPDVGSLSSITDTLNDFNIENQAAQIDTASLNQLIEPFLAFVKKEESKQFVLVSPTGKSIYDIYTGNDTAFTLSQKEFSILFGGIIIVIDKNDKTKFNYKRALHFLTNLVVIVSLGSLIIIQSSFEPYATAFSLLIFIGCIFSLFLYAHSIGVNNNFLNRFCSISKQTNCNSVLQSNAARINKYLSLTDIGVVYFTFQLLSTLFLKHGNHLIYAISIPAAAFSFYSVYQQAFAIKKWCPLCLGVVGVLASQGIVATLLINPSAIRIIDFISLLFLFLLTCVSWYYFKGIHRSSRRLLQTETDLLAFKRNYHLFLPFYKNETSVNDAALLNQTQIIIGKITAPVSITLITNPLCEACQKAHKMLTKILSQYPNDVALRTVFYVPYQNQNDPRTMIAGWLADIYHTNPNEGGKAIEKWYTNPDLNAFDKLKLPKEVVSKQQGFLQIHAQWCVANRLTLTPLLLINNKLFPLIYRTEDLHYHIENIIEFERTQNDDSSESYQSTTVLVDNT